MPLREGDKAALRAHWFGEALPPRLAGLMRRDWPGRSRGLSQSPVAIQRRGSRRRLRAQMQDFLSSLGAEHSARTRRMLLAYGPKAVDRLAEQLDSEDAEIARKAAAEILNHFIAWSHEEEEAARAETERESQFSAEGLTEEQTRQLLGILADASGAGAPDGQGDDQPAR